MANSNSIKSESVVERLLAVCNKASEEFNYETCLWINKKTIWSNFSKDQSERMLEIVNAIGKLSRIGQCIEHFDFSVARGGRETIERSLLAIAEIVDTELLFRIKKRIRIEREIIRTGRSSANVRGHKRKGVRKNG